MARLMARAAVVPLALVFTACFTAGDFEPNRTGDASGNVGGAGGNTIQANHPCNPSVDKCPQGYACTANVVGPENICRKACSVNGALCGSDGQVCLLNFEGKLFCSAGCSLTNPEPVCGPNANCGVVCSVGGIAICSDCSSAGTGAGYCSDATDCPPGFGCSTQYGCLKWCRIGKGDCAGCAEGSNFKVQIGADTYGLCPP